MMKDRKRIFLDLLDLVATQADYSFDGLSANTKCALERCALEMSHVFGNSESELEPYNTDRRRQKDRRGL